MRRRGESGFTLIEIAIGMAVLGLGVVSALQVFGGSMQLARNAGKRSEAVMHAKALLDSSLWSPELIATESQGEIGDGFRWQRVIRRAGAEEKWREGGSAADAGSAGPPIRVPLPRSGSRHSAATATQAVQ